MASIDELILKKSGELTSLCQEKEVDRYYDLSRVEKACALAEEHIPGPVVEVADQKMGEVKDELRKRGLDTSGRSKELQGRLIRWELENAAGETVPPEGKNGTDAGYGGSESRNGGNSRGTGEAASVAYPESHPPSKHDGRKRLPDPSLQSHFDSVEDRLIAIRESARTATRQAVEEERGVVVIESYKPRDKKTPVRIADERDERHPDEMVVFRCVRYAVATQLPDGQAMEVALSACDQAMSDLQSTTVITAEESEREASTVEIVPDGSEWKSGNVVLMRMEVPRWAFPTETAREEAVRLTMNGKIRTVR